MVYKRRGRKSDYSTLSMLTFSIGLWLTIIIRPICTWMTSLWVTWHHRHYSFHYDSQHSPDTTALCLYLSSKVWTLKTENKSLRHFMNRGHPAQQQSALPKWVPVFYTRLWPSSGTNQEVLRLGRIGLDFYGTSGGIYYYECHPPIINE